MKKHYIFSLSCTASFILALIFSLSFVPPAVAKEKSISLLRIPVFFVTDRNLVQAKNGNKEIVFGPHRKYLAECKHDPYIGTAYCVVENVENIPLTEDLKGLGWREAEAKDKLGQSEATLITGSDFEQIETRFYDSLHNQASAMEDKNIVVFAHGYKNSFASGLNTAAKIAYYARRPFVYYSWPSVCAFRSYTSDENNVEWSQEHYDRMIEKLDELCQLDPTLKIRLYAHSMGVRLVVRACPLLREKGWLKEAVLVCPDIDDGLVRHYLARYGSVKGTCTIRIYVSQHDKALAISQILHGGYCRFGECADSVSQVAMGCFASGSSSKLVQDAEEDKKIAEYLEKTKNRMQTIDFTNLDYGILGHKVPAKLICSMSFTNAPCSGVKLLPEQSGQRSGLSQKLSHMTKLDYNKELSVKGTCLRAVKDNVPIDKKLAKVLVQATEN